MEAEIAVIGGSGVYSMAAMKGAASTRVKTPYGLSPEVTVGRLGGRNVAFLPRHGKGHTVPPHMVNYRANIWALKELGVKRILATTACGTMSPRIKPGDLALLTQFLDFTKVRANTFYEGKEGVVHVDITEPYCIELRRVLLATAKRLRIKLHPKSTYACMDGPRFETAAEIIALRRLGSDLVGMTNIPECVLARELEMCYSAVGIATNHAAGFSKVKLTHADVLEMMQDNVAGVQKLFMEAIPKIPEERKCMCKDALDGAVIKS
ncbi:MAG: S-methyl-5'-thioadenosine phosphorylase [Candidatus Hadarchaeota archaeon]